MKTEYKWNIELLDLPEGADVHDDHHVLVDYQPSKQCPTRWLRRNERLVLVRDTLTKDGSVDDRMWAYVGRDGKLPAEFRSASGVKTGISVPKRFHKELAKVRPASAASSALKRYLIFAGSKYHPYGGWKDFVGSADSVDEAKDVLLHRNDEWKQVVDSATGAYCFCAET